MARLYKYVKVSGHPNATVFGCMLEHRLVVERAMGKLLAKGHVVHHLNGDRYDNRLCNLVVCENIGYHKLIHHRDTSLRETGDPNQYKCAKCNTWKSVDEFYIRKSAYLPNGTCKQCRREIQRKYYRQNSENIIEYQKRYRAEHKEELSEYERKRSPRNG